MRLGLILAGTILLAACDNAESRPEAVAVAYAEQNFGRKSFDPDGKGYNINVIECGSRWCVQLYPAHDPISGDVRYIGGGVELELEKSNLKVVKHERTQ